MVGQAALQDESFLLIIRGDRPRVSPSTRGGDSKIRKGRIRLAILGILTTCGGEYITRVKYASFLFYPSSNPVLL